MTSMEIKNKVYSTLIKFIDNDRDCPACGEKSECTGWIYRDPKFIISYLCPTHKIWNLCVCIEDLDNLEEEV